MVKITFPDGSVKEFAKGTTAYRVAESISPRLAADALAASVNGATVDMSRPIEEDASIRFFKWDDDEGKHAFWHTSSHLLADDRSKGRRTVFACTDDEFTHSSTKIRKAECNAKFI